MVEPTKIVLVQPRILLISITVIRLYKIKVKGQRYEKMINCNVQVQSY